MKSIQERAWEYAVQFRKGDSVFAEGYIQGAKEQKAIDDAEIVRLKAAWEKEAEINHDAEMAYKQGRHDAIGMACEWLAENIDSRARFFEDGVWVQRSIAGEFRKAMEE